MSNGDFSKRTGGSSHRPSGFGWGLQGYREHQEQALDPQPCEPSRRQQHSRRSEPPRHRASPRERSQYVYRNDDSDEFNPNDYPKEFWAPVNPASPDHSNSQHGHYGSHSSSRESSHSSSRESSHIPPMNYLVVMDHHTVMDFLVDLSADI
jgi:hypothetical protein